MTELHIAIKLNQPSVVRSILSQQLVDIHAIDEDGNQGAHIAARLNRVDCMKVLIEYGANMGRKNFNNGLTPLGESQMNGNVEVATLIRDNYSTIESDGYIWHEDFSRECAAWYDSFDESRQRLQWVRLGPHGEVDISATPPPIDVQRVIKARNKCGRNVVRRLHPGSLPSQQQLEFDRKKQEEKRVLAAMMKSRAVIVEERCATKLQSHFRKMKAKKLARMQKMKRVAANHIQRRYVIETPCFSMTLVTTNLNP